MKNIPKFLWGSFRVALRLALEEISMGFGQNDWLRQVRGWRLFLILPTTLAPPATTGQGWKREVGLEVLEVFCRPVGRSLSCNAACGMQTESSHPGQRGQLFGFVPLAEIPGPFQQTSQWCVCSGGRGRHQRSGQLLSVQVPWAIGVLDSRSLPLRSLVPQEFKPSRTPEIARNAIEFGNPGLVGQIGQGQLESSRNQSNGHERLGEIFFDGIIDRGHTVGRDSGARDARYGLRGVRVGEASHQGPQGRRTRDNSDEVLDNLERELRSIESDDEPLVRSMDGRNVSSLEAIVATEPLEAARRRRDSQFRARRGCPVNSAGGVVDRDADECSVSSESCCGEQEELIGEETVE